MDFQLDDGLQVLRTTPAVLRAMLADKSRSWVHNNYGDRTFSPFDVVGHLIHGERADWMVRAEAILQHGEAVPFDPFDRYAMFDDSRGKDIHELLDTFESLRRSNVERLEQLKLSPEQLALRGTHPEFGPVTLRALLATWVAHDLNHIAQIAKAMAYQYGDQVGPWRQYLSILSPPTVLAD